MSPIDQLAALIDNLPEEISKRAFTHASWTDRRTDSYERLAFIGDSVLQLALSAEMYPRFSGSTAGELTKIRAQAVSGRACAEVAQALGLPARLEREAPAHGGRARTVEQLLATERTLAELTEAAIGACFLTYGFERTAEAVRSAFDSQLEFAAENLVDFKSALQEKLARDGSTVTYEVIEEAGPPHDRRFEVAARTDDRTLGTGSGRTKKDAEQAAAEEALDELGS